MLTLAAPPIDQGIKFWERKQEGEKILKIMSYKQYFEISGVLEHSGGFFTFLVQCHLKEDWIQNAWVQNEELGALCRTTGRPIWTPSPN